MKTDSLTQNLRSERGSIELTQQAIIGFFLVVMGLGSVGALLKTVDQQAQTSSSWLQQENPSCPSGNCSDFTIGSCTGRQDPYGGPCPYL